MSVMLCQTPFVLSGIVFHLMSLLAPSTSDTGDNVYTRYYIEDSCSSDDETEYNLDETGLASAAEFVTARDSSRYSHQQTNNSVITCRLKIVPPHRYGVLLTASRVSFPTTSDSCKSFIQIYEYNKPIKICWNRKLGKTSFTTVGNLTIVYHLNRMDFQNPNDDYNVEVSNAENFRAISGIKLTATAYHRVYPRCNEDQFQCRHIRCIWKGFTCDDLNNCGDNTDERTYWPSNCNSVYEGCKHYVIMTHTRDSNGMRSVVLRAIALRPELRAGFEKKQCTITLEPRTGYGLQLRTRLTPFNGSQMIGDYLEILLENGAKKEFLMFVPQNNNGESVFITKCRLQIMYHFNMEKGVELKGDTALTITTFKEGFSQSLKDNNNYSSKCTDALDSRCKHVAMNAILGWTLVCTFTITIFAGALCLYLQRQKLFFDGKKMISR